ncbi:MAG: peroxiredoxin [Elstera sp.]
MSDMPMTLPRLGDAAPDFEADSTHGRLALRDFRGSWLVLFSHPADFTPVCTTEFIALAGAAERLSALNCQLLGLSIDSVYSHIAWLRTIEAQFGTTIPFPVLADHDRAVALRYGMLMPSESSTEASRCLFVIDPDGIVRAMIYYPMIVGRNIEEVVRLVTALATTATAKAAAPANWQPGEPLLEPAPRTVEAAAERAAGADWFLQYRRPR